MKAGHLFDPLPSEKADKRMIPLNFKRRKNRKVKKSVKERVVGVLSTLSTFKREAVVKAKVELI